MCSILSHILVKHNGEDVDILVSCKVKKKGEGVYLAECPELDYDARGKTPKKAKDNLKETIQEVIIDAIQRDVLDKILLEECGFHVIEYDGQRTWKMYGYLNENATGLEVLKIHLKDVSIAST